MFSEIAQNTITLIQQPFGDKLTIGTEKSGLYIYSLKSGKLVGNILAGKTIRRIFRDSQHDLWINTQEFGIYKVDSSFTSIRHYELIPNEIESIVDDERQYIYEDSQKNLWIALHGGGLALFNRETNAFEFYRNSPNDNATISSDNVYCITEDNSGLLWVGTGPADGGVNKIYTINEAFKRIGLEDHIITGNENVVRAVMIDCNGNTWAGTKAGNVHILDQEYKVIHKIHEIPLATGSFPGQNAYTFLQDNEGYVWIGTKGGGVFVSENPVCAPATRYDKIRFHHYAFDPADSSSLSSNIIYSMIQDTNNNIWIGSFEGGLNLVQSRTADRLVCARINTSNSAISSDKVRYLYQDHENRIWIATDFGINYFDVEKFDPDQPDIHSQLFDPRRKSSLSYNDVIHIYEDSRHTLWLGTSGGGINRLVARYTDSLTFEHINIDDGLINDIVYGIVEDQRGKIWFSTDHGISAYNPSDKTFENFDQSNNLNTDAFNENTCAVTADGQLLFGSNDGLLVVEPGKIKGTNYQPYVALTNFQLFNKDIDITDPDSPLKQDIETLQRIELKYNQSSFSIEYAALSYFAPSKNRYAFRLKNFDADWNEVGNQTKATYTNLAPGNYVFEVKAANWNSDWNDTIRSIEIVIMPPWYKTTTLYLTYAVLFIILFEIIRRSYSRYQKLQNDLEVEKRVNDIKLRFFTNISHEIRTPLTLIIGPIHDLLEVKNIPANIATKLHLIEKNGKRMLRLVNQLLDFRKIQKSKMTLNIHQVELVSFIHSIIENFDLIADHKKIKIVFDAPVDPVSIWVDPNKFDSVIFNILSNALKFSPKGGNVHVRLDEGTSEYVDLAISDEGVGIPKNKLPQVFERFSPLTQENEEFGSSGIGLAYSYEIMKLHHGDILVNSEYGKGSEFIIRILTGNTHFSQEEIRMEEGESLYKVRHEKVTEVDFELETKETEDLEKDIHILLVEDNHQILEYLSEYLQKEFTISARVNGHEALEFVNQHQPDLIITDIMMPVMNGIELTKKLKESMDTSHIPVIMLTAKSAIEDQIEGIETGAEAYILKPFNMTYVHAVINNLLKQRSIIQAKYIHNKDEGIAGIKITTKDEKFLNDINRLIVDNYSDPEFNIDKLVDTSYVGRTVFYHKIKSLTGLSPIDFLRQKRLHIAAQLLLETDYNISEVAIMTGFNDVKNFSKRFKEIFNRTPSQYKDDALAQKTIN
ncbi:MAG: two-component regulator propeller domain-containing protein [Cyclobacteriaceae bacterium]|nr:two-component regulator propeller domain-containing protein [Cyclobacteriaceae bacterium]